MDHFSFLAIATAALSSFLLGGLWYSPVLFGPRWQREAGDTRKPGQGHPAKVFGVSFVFALVAAVAYPFVVSPTEGVIASGIRGLTVGAGIVAASFGINYQFANRSGTMWLIDGGYHTVQFGLYGLILGWWR
jgi:hypothetical protein